MNTRKRPIELAEEVVAADNWYSLVISKIDGKVQVQDIQNKIFTEKENEEGFQQTQSGAYMSKYAELEDYREGIALHTTHNFATQIDRYNELSEDQKIIVDSIKQISNTFPTAFFWHNGHADTQCQFIGLHIHMLVGSKEQLSQIYRYRNLISKMKARGVDVKSQKVRHLQALGKHLLKPPRVLMGCNNMHLCSQLYRWSKEIQSEQDPVDENNYEQFNFDRDEMPPETNKNEEGATGVNFLSDYLKINQKEKMLEKQEITIPARGKGYIQKMSELDEFQMANVVRSDSQRSFDQEVRGTGNKVLPTSKTANKVEILKTIITKHNKKTVPDLLQSIIEMGDKSELELFRTLRLGPNFQLILSQALSELELEARQRGDTYIDHYIQNCSYKENTFNVTQTTYLFLQWCKEQRIVPGEFLLQLFCVLDKALPKINCFTLQGQSNAGKTYWTQPLMDNSDVVGQTIQSADFAYQNCIGKDIIQIPELKFTKPEQVEESKKIFEGLGTMVNVKNKEPARLQRTPVVLTCNQLPWTGFENEKSALENRMFRYLNLKPSDVLSGLGDRGPDPRFYGEVFGYIREEITNDILWPPLPESDQWYLTVEKITTKLNEIHERTLTLDEHITNYVLKHHRVTETNQLYPTETNEIVNTLEDNLSKIDISRYDIEDNNPGLAQRLLKWFAKLRNDNNKDYFFDFQDYKKPKLYSALTKQEYLPMSDIDEPDFKSFKRGYTLIQRILIRIRHYPSVMPVTPNTDEKINHMLKVCLEKMSCILLFIIKATEHLKLDRSQFMAIEDELQMDTGVKAESTPNKILQTTRKRKLDIDPNETQGPEMENPNNPIYKPGPTGDASNTSSSDSNEPSPKKAKIYKRPVRRRLEFLNPWNEVPKLKIDRHKMKVTWESIPETATLEELERKVSLENILIDTGDLLPEEIPERSNKQKFNTLGYNVEADLRRCDLQRKLNNNPITAEEAQKYIDWAFSGNQECYKLAEKDSGFFIHELISIANKEIEYKEPEMDVASESRSSVPTTPDHEVIVISDTEEENSERKRSPLLTAYYRESN